MAVTSSRPGPEIRVSEEVGQAADRRHGGPIASVTVWALLCGGAVIGLHAATAGFSQRLGSYRTGLITAAAFLLAPLYSVRKHTLWLSVRWLRVASRLPRSVARRLVLMDRLETWRNFHVTVGVVALLPFWWHFEAGPGSPLELTLAAVVALVILSGVGGTMIHDLLPHATRVSRQQEVRIEDVDAQYHALYVEAEEGILGHSEGLVRAYLANVRPLLVGSQSPGRLLWATLSGSDPAPRACARARAAAGSLAVDSDLYGGLVAIAERKIRLEHNRFNLRIGRVWLKFHVALVLIMVVLIVFHVTGVLYFLGF